MAAKRDPLGVLKKNFQSNLATDYTEKIEELDRSFDYAENSQNYWSIPESSLLYGSPLYNEATESQRLALSHLGWVLSYIYTANSETEGVRYNQITAGLYGQMGGDYEALSQQLLHEVDQERSHIHAFYKISYRTINELMGSQGFSKSANKKARLSTAQALPLFKLPSGMVGRVTSRMAQGEKALVSPYLKQLDEQKQPIMILRNGFFRFKINRSDTLQPLTEAIVRNWGASPYTACSYYTVRYMANLLLKSGEHKTFRYYRELEKREEKIPVPTAVSCFHFLDEAFHTTTSLFVGRDLYGHLSDATAYEKFLVNAIIYLAQKSELNSISGMITHKFRADDEGTMQIVYDVLRSPIFELQPQEALEWLEKCLCQEHEGFYLNIEYHRALLTELRRMADGLDFLWPVNREMKVTAMGGSVDRALKNNIQAFRRFAKSVDISK